mgnify:CR=1 FL=1
MALDVVSSLFKMCKAVYALAKAVQANTQRSASLMLKIESLESPLSCKLA